MASAIGDLVVRFGADTSRFNRGTNAVTHGLGKLNNAVSATARKFGSLGGVLAGGGMMLAARQAVRAATVQEQAERKLAAVLRATGGAAGISAKELIDYAGNLQKVTNYSDEATISAMGTLATFKNINGTMFKNAIKVTQDMAAVIGQDMKSAVLQVGKALNDPLKGLTALSRVGVSFTREQVAQIRNYVKMGNLIGAQRIILGELTSEFGGAASAMSDELTRLDNELGDLQEKFGTIVKPPYVGGLKVVVVATEKAISLMKGLQVGTEDMAYSFALMAKRMTFGMSDSINAFEDSMRRASEAAGREYVGGAEKAVEVTNRMSNGLAGMAGNASKAAVNMALLGESQANWQKVNKQTIESIKKMQFDLATLGMSDRQKEIQKMISGGIDSHLVQQYSQLSGQLEQYNINKSAMEDVRQKQFDASTHGMPDYMRRAHEMQSQGVDMSIIQRYIRASEELIGTQKAEQQQMERIQKLRQKAAMDKSAVEMIMRSLETPMEAFRRKVEKINRLLQTGALKPEFAKRAYMDALKDLKGSGVGQQREVMSTGLAGAATRGSVEAYSAIMRNRQQMQVGGMATPRRPQTYAEILQSRRENYLADKQRRRDAYAATKKSMQQSQDVGRKPEDQMAASIMSLDKKFDKLHSVLSDMRNDQRDAETLGIPN